VSTGPAIGFLSDYGLRDEFVGVCHGVIASRCPAARVIDICHEVPRHDVRGGALMLAAALAHLPAGVALAVVDPGVGSTRRALALRTGTGDRVLVGPDNGLLLPAAERLGGVAEAFDVSAAPVALRPLSPTFHGRDLFAPVAAALAAGVEPDRLGERIPAERLERLELASAELRAGTLVAHVLRVDTFGNLALDALPAQLERIGVGSCSEVAVRAHAGEHRARYVRCFADVPAGALLLYEDSRQALALAVNLGSAADRLGADALAGELLLSPA